MPVDVLDLGEVAGAVVTETGCKEKHDEETYEEQYEDGAVSHNANTVGHAETFLIVNIIDEIESGLGAGKEEDGETEKEILPADVLHFPKHVP